MSRPISSAPLRSERLTLRRPGAGDAARVAELCCDYDIASMTTRMPWPYTLNDAEAFVAQCADQDPARDATFLIEHEPDGVVGCVGLFTLAGQAPEIGYWIGRPWWGRGLATEAVRRALDWAQGDWGRRRVVAGHFSDNPASGSVLCKAGFLYTGEVQLKPSRARGCDAATRMMVWLA